MSELLSVYEEVYSGEDETRKRNIEERLKTLQTITRDPSSSHDNTLFHYTGDPVYHTNYKEIDWTIRLFHSIKDNLPQGNSHIHIMHILAYMSNVI